MLHVPQSSHRTTRVRAANIGRVGRRTCTDTWEEDIPDTLEKLSKCINDYKNKTVPDNFFLVLPHRVEFIFNHGKTWCEHFLYRFVMVVFLSYFFVTSFWFPPLVLIIARCFTFSVPFNISKLLIVNHVCFRRIQCAIGLRGSRRLSLRFKRNASIRMHQVRTKLHNERCSCHASSTLLRL